jgi:uncharacterized membrane protein YdbT with pleckstrin-like domain
METECVCEYDDSNDKGDSLSCPIVERKYVFTRFKTLKDLSSVRGNIDITPDYTVLISCFWNELSAF